MAKYPEFETDLRKLKDNVNIINNLCKKNSVEVAVVIKSVTGKKEIAKAIDSCNVSFIASSRVNQLKKIKGYVDSELMFIRIPGVSEIEDVIKYSDISLNSEIEILKKLNEEAKKQKKTHEVILMKDIGDLREGFFKDEEIIEAALLVEKELDNLVLAGVGTNIGCYGSVEATKEKLQELVDIAEKIERKIGRKLKYISGGATSSLPRVIDGTLPKRINQLRIGEAMMLGNLEESWGCGIEGMHKDVFKLRCEVIEVKDKPTYPIGKIAFNAFGDTPKYVDKGIRKRAIIGIGAVDYAYTEKLYTLEKGIEVIGASSDHTILDIEDAARDIKVGDIIEFDVCYSTLVHLTNDQEMNYTFINNE